MSTTGAIVLDRFPMARGHTFDRHVHTDHHQLAWASAGVVMVDVDDRCWVLPPNLALWIPAGVWHATSAVRESVLEGIYIVPATVPLSWPEPTVLSVGPLARQLIRYLAVDLDHEHRARAEAVLLDVLAPVGDSTIELPMPIDPRARAVAEALRAAPADRRSLDQLARTVGSSPRTLLRTFLTDTGLTFNQWRTHARLQAAMVRLCDGDTVSRVAPGVGYATPSAFVAAFRRVTGHTPAAYFGRAAALDPATPAGVTYLSDARDGGA